tara:strand:- start:827 stop:1009 length:183 start_codon:yes stop_codon:yes gene_type:complete
MDKYEITFKIWDKIAEIYQEKFMELYFYDDTYDLFIQSLEQNAQLLEVACGPGNFPSRDY